jgi:hypothetical protein
MRELNAGRLSPAAEVDLEQVWKPHNIVWEEGLCAMKEQEKICTHLNVCTVISLVRWDGNDRNAFSIANAPLLWPITRVIPKTFRRSH